MEPVERSLTALHLEGSWGGRWFPGGPPRIVPRATAYGRVVTPFCVILRLYLVSPRF
jgi:hypothetical protein